MAPQKNAARGSEGTPSGADRELSEFLLRACHDLRAALRPVRAHAELLLRDPATPRTAEVEQRLGFIADGARRMDLLADGLVGYSIALQTERRTFQSISLDVLLRNVLTRLDRELREAGALVSYEKLPRVAGDPDRLMQVFDNLLRNAIRHRGPAAPRIHITVAPHPQGWLFAVGDNGPGVEAEFLECTFKPFERLGAKNREGPGLGLTICRAIVERHGGRIWAESSAGGGATFLFTLPAE